MSEKSQSRGLIMRQPARGGERAIPTTDAERAARVKLAACYRVFDHLGWTEGIFNHITLRVPGPETIFLINPFGLNYREVTASNLVAIDIDGNPVRPTPHPINRAGFVTHSAIHGSIAAAHCVMHTHTNPGSAVACSAAGLSHDTFYGAQLTNRVAYHEFEGVTVNPDEQQRMLASIGDKRVVILRNHGLLTWGETLEEAFVWLWVLQRACEIQVMAASLGPMTPLPTSVREQCRNESPALQPQVCVSMFEAWVRKIEAAEPSYRS